MPFVSRRSGAAAARPLSFVPPLLPTLVEEPPVGKSWWHEIKHDGYRTLVAVEEDRARAWTRNGHDWSDRYRRIVDAAAALPCRSALIDGEAIVQDERGLSDLGALRHAMAEEPHRLVFFAFYLLSLDGQDLRSLPIEERRARLKHLIGAPDPHSAIQFSESLAGDGPTIFAAVEKLGLEGVVSKQAGSRYRSGKSTAWLKAKCMTESEFLVIGAAPNPGGAPFALLAREDVDGLSYAGSAFVTLPQPARERFWTRLSELETSRPVVAGIDARKASWCRPEMRVRARHLRGGDMLRHASLVGLSQKGAALEDASCQTSAISTS